VLGYFHFEASRSGVSMNQDGLQRFVVRDGKIVSIPTCSPTSKPSTSSISNSALSTTADLDIGAGPARFDHAGPENSSSATRFRSACSWKPPARSFGSAVRARRADERSVSSTAPHGGHGDRVPASATRRSCGDGSLLAWGALSSGSRI
jgi:hypothetical protein